MVELVELEVVDKVEEEIHVDKVEFQEQLILVVVEVVVLLDVVDVQVQEVQVL